MNQGNSWKNHLDPEAKPWSECIAQGFLPCLPNSQAWLCFCLERQKYPLLFTHHNADPLVTAPSSS